MWKVGSNTLDREVAVVFLNLKWGIARESRLSR
jgi:hypothetical protein